MAENMKCEICGANTEFKVSGNTEGFFCTRCDWALVTTRIPKIAQDITKYKIFLLIADSENKDHIKLLSEAAGINFLQAKKMLEEERPLVAEGEAIEISKVKNTFDQAGIQYEIKPVFPY